MLEEDLYFSIKGPKLGFSKFFQKILPFDFPVLILSKISNLRSRLFVTENFLFKVWPKIYLTNPTAGFVKSNISL